MPHYRDGEAAQVGDYVKGKTWDGKTIVGQVQSVIPGSISCNMTVSYTVMQPVAVSGTHTIGEFDLLHRDTPET